ncbi:MAG: DUF5305 domain-containing protein [Firmicutes bacterium]|nr:DUF5305 domain-containing protein [Bacillota bacterium]
MKLGKKVKAFLVAMCIVVAAVLLFLGIYTWRVPQYEEMEETLFSYQSKGSIDYKVFLRPNVVYEEPYLPKDRNYILKYIDYIEAKFVYEYKGSAAADLTTEYLVTAKLQGLHGKGIEVLWSKEYVLIPPVVERERNAVKTLELAVPVKLDDYLAEREKIFADSEVNSPVVLEVVFAVHTAASSTDGSLDDSIESYLVIPIGESVFKIESSPETVGEDAITKTVKFALAVNTAKLSILFIFSALFFGFAIAVAVLVKTADPPDEFAKTIAQIFKEHGERLAGMEHSLAYQASEFDIIDVNSIDDMVKIADELSQPILYYKVDTPLERKIEFYVFDGSRVYYMVIFGEILPTESHIQAELDS